jgi:hypothetical protein
MSLETVSFFSLFSPPFFFSLHFTLFYLHATGWRLVGRMAAFVLLRYARVSGGFSILRPRELGLFSGRQNDAVGTTEAGEPTNKS